MSSVTAAKHAGGQAGRRRLEDLISALRELVAESGGMPPEREAAEALNVKRHLLRRALESLRATGELEPARAGRRAHPAPPQGESLVRCANPLEVMELRMVLEPALARFAALRASPADISRIQRAAITPPGISPSQADIIFHKAVAEGSRNSLASELYILLHQVASDGRLRFADSDEATTPERVRQRDTEHVRIAGAIAGRDPEAAEWAMREHLAVVQRKIISRLVPGAANGQDG